MRALMASRWLPSSAQTTRQQVFSYSQQLRTLTVAQVLAAPQLQALWAVGAVRTLPLLLPPCLAPPTSPAACVSVRAGDAGECVSR